MYVGVHTGLCGIVLLVFALLQLATTPASGLIVLLLAALYIWAGLATIQQYRAGFVLATILSLNPIWWIANTIYARNRWQEFRPLPNGTSSEPALPFSSNSPFPGTVGSDAEVIQDGRG
jgi:hypothetical protein